MVVDTTFKLCENDKLLLTPLTTADKNNKRRVVAFLVSQHENTEAMKFFFNVLKQKLREILAMNRVNKYLTIVNIFVWTDRFQRITL